MGRYPENVSFDSNQWPIGEGFWPTTYLNQWRAGSGGSGGSPVGFNPGCNAIRGGAPKRCPALTKSRRAENRYHIGRLNLLSHPVPGAMSGLVQACGHGRRVPLPHSASHASVWGRPGSRYAYIQATWSSLSSTHTTLKDESPTPAVPQACTAAAEGARVQRVLGHSFRACPFPRRSASGVGRNHRRSGSRADRTGWRQGQPRPRLVVAGGGCGSCQCPGSRFVCEF
jgi:hypothetical protein